MAKVIVSLTYETVVSVPDDLPDDEKYKEAGRICDEVDTWIGITIRGVKHHCEFQHAEILGLK